MFSTLKTTGFTDHISYKYLILKNLDVIVNATGKTGKELVVFKLFFSLKTTSRKSVPGKIKPITG